MLDELLMKCEGKTLEFKENTNNVLGIIKTVIAFANTAGGMIVIGIKDKTREVIGIEKILFEKERLSNTIADSIEPLLIPDIEVLNYANKELLLINVPYLIGPYYHKKGGVDNGTYIRLGSTNRLADQESIATLQRLAKQISYDALPCIGADVSELDHKRIKETLGKSLKNISQKNYESIGLVSQQHKKKYATYAGIMLYALDLKAWMPDFHIQCVCFPGTLRKDYIDQKEIQLNLIDAIAEVIFFIKRHTSVSAKIGTVKRVDISQYPEDAVREAVINAIVHADYAMSGAAIQISVFQDRIELINPGSLTFGQTLNSALSGISKLRNPIIGRIFRELKLIERLGTGLHTIINSYEKTDAKPPIFEEIDNFFKVTLHAIPYQISPSLEIWEKQLLSVLAENVSLGMSEIAALWNLSERAALSRINKMLEKRLLERHSKSKNDPNTVYTKKQ